MVQPREFLQALFEAAAAGPVQCVPRNLPDAARGRTIVIGAGKAAASMARAVEATWTGVLTGLVVTRYGHAVPTSRIQVREAALPVPDTAGLEASRGVSRACSYAHRSRSFVRADGSPAPTNSNVRAGGKAVIPLTF